MELVIEIFVVDLIERLKLKGECDLMCDFVVYFFFFVILIMFGVNFKDSLMFWEWVEVFMFGIF